MVTRSIRLLPIAATIVLLVIAYSFGRGVAALIIRMVRRWERARAVRALPLVAAAALALLMIVLTWANAHWQTQIPVLNFNGRGNITGEPFPSARLDFSLNDLQTLSTKPDGGIILAHDIVTSLVGANPKGWPGHPAWYLLPQSAPEGRDIVLNEATSLVTISSHRYRAYSRDLKPQAVTWPAGIEVGLEGDVLRVRHSSGDPQEAVRHLLIRLDLLGGLLFLLWLTWLGLRGVIRTIDGVITRYRRRRNVCIACAYPLAGGASLASATSTR